MIVNCLEFGAWILGVVLLHEGLASWSKTHHRGAGKAISLAGAIILLVGAGFWLWNMQASQHLASVLQTPPMTTRPTLRDELEKLPPPQRKELTTRFAKAVFVSGGELADVVTEGGSWTSYAPSAEDVRARDRQMKLIAEVDAQRRELVAAGQIAKQNSLGRLLSLIVVSFTGLVARRLRAQRS